MRRYQFPFSPFYIPEIPSINFDYDVNVDQFLAQAARSHDPNLKVREVQNPDGTISRFTTYQSSTKTSKETQTDITGNGLSTSSEILGRCWLTGTILKQYFDIINSGPLKEKNGHIMDPLAVQLIKNLISSENYFKKHDFSSLKYLIIPISNAQFVNEKGGSHWSVLAFCKNSKTFYYFDSLLTHNLEDAKLVIKKLTKVLGVDRDDAIKICKCPQQNIGFECGVYMIITVERLVRDLNANKGINANCLEGLSLNEFDILKKRCLLAYVLQNKGSIPKEKIFSIMLENSYKKERTEKDQKLGIGKNAAIPEPLSKGAKINAPLSVKKNTNPMTTNGSKFKKGLKPKK